MFFKIILLLSPFLLNSWSEASKERFGVVLYRNANQQGSAFPYSAHVQCGNLPHNGCGFYYSSAERVHGSCVYLCPKPYLEIGNPREECETLRSRSHPKGARNIDNMDMKVMSICDCTYRRGFTQISEGEYSRDLREINYYGSPKRKYYSEKYFMH